MIEMKKFNVFEINILTNCKKTKIMRLTLPFDELRVIYPQ